MASISFMVTIKVAEAADAEDILNIYAPYIRHSFITFENEVPSVSQFAERIAHYKEKFPWLILRIDDAAAGYVYASPHRERIAYQWCCESSIYMSDRFKGKGIAAFLYDALFSILQLQGIRNVYAGITLPNQASVRLHEKMGFTPLAVYNNVGYKMGEWKSVGWWQRQLNEYDPNPDTPQWFPQMPENRCNSVMENAQTKIARILNC